jgi:hypothetical protein
MEFLIAIWVLVLFVCVMNLIRVDRFGKLLRAEISRVSTARLSGNYDVQWPNVQASYDNLKWYDVFNYNFKSLIVYDTKY